MSDVFLYNISIYGRFSFCKPATRHFWRRMLLGSGRNISDFARRKKTSVGYSGGAFPNPTYEDVCSQTTGHAEVVQIQYNPAEISYEKLLEVFLVNHNPTTKNQQGPDIGSQYRSVIFYHTPEQKTAAEKSKADLGKFGKWKAPIVTEIVPATPFYRAEDYHQKIFNEKINAGTAPYTP